MKRIIATILYKLYALRRGRIRQFVLYLVLKLEGGYFLSETLRKILRDYHDIDIGLYSYGWFSFGPIAEHTKIGRYCSIGPDVRILPENHPLNYKSTHPYFYLKSLGFVEKEMIPAKKIEIGNDVWIGQNAIILGQVSKIGDGAVIGAGAIVTKNVPDYAIVAGVPAKVIRYRFSKEIIQKLKKEQWWNKSIEELKESFDEFTKPYENV